VDAADALPPSDDATAGSSSLEAAPLELSAPAPAASEHDAIADPAALDSSALTPLQPVPPAANVSDPPTKVDQLPTTGELIHT